jgi:arylsulfatase
MARRLWLMLAAAGSLFSVLAFLVGCGETTPPSMSLADKNIPVVLPVEGPARPNILLIVVDDLGYTDLGVYGGEIPTPNLDTLARSGILFTNVYTSPTCSPTRAMLFSGADNHVAGLGNMAEGLADNQREHPGYEGYLNFRIASLPELLKDAGYRTYMSGKWHLGLTDETSPAARGFERSFALLQGGAGHFSNMLPLVGPGKAMYREDRRLLDALPDHFYSTRFYAKRLIEYIDADSGDMRPFFAYLAFSAPHWPLQAPEASIARHRGKYAQGFDVLHARRLERMAELGIIPSEVEPFPRLHGERSWDELSEEEKKIEARKMEIYAAMVEDIDIYVGEVIDYLKSTGQFDNTFIFFMSDNGAEGHHLDLTWDAMAEWVKECCDNSYENMGRADSYIWYGPNWGRVSTGPWRMFKGYTSEGGIKAPAFAHYPRSVQSGVIDRNFLTVMDVMPTLLELAGVAHPGTTYKGREVRQMKGRSMLSLLKGEVNSVHRSDYVMGWELYARRAIRQGPWKIIYEPYHQLLEPRPAGITTDTWQLYNLREDPAELDDLSQRYPAKRSELIGFWEEYARENGVIIPNQLSGY